VDALHMTAAAIVSQPSRRSASRECQYFFSSSGSDLKSCSRGREHRWVVSTAWQNLQTDPRAWTEATHRLGRDVLDPDQPRIRLVAVVDDTLPACDPSSSSSNAFLQRRRRRGRRTRGSSARHAPQLGDPVFAFALAAAEMVCRDDGGAVVGVAVQAGEVLCGGRG